MRHGGLRRILLTALLAGATAVGLSCRGDGSEDEADGKLRVFASIAPAAFLAERVGAEHVHVEVLVQPGDSPHTYQPTMKQMARLGRAKLLFRIGAGFEDALVERLASAHEGLRIVDLREGITLLAAARRGHDEPGHDHAAHEPDPHTWLSPKLAARQARTVCEALCKADAPHAEAYRENLRALVADLDELDRKIAAALAPLKGRTFYVFHPAFGYFARAYGLKQEAVEAGGGAPSAKHLQALVDRARAEGVKVIFVQPQFSDRAARTVAQQIGGAVVPIDPLARDYIANLTRVAEAIRKALAPEPQ
jgi:zinc transport system substrate-binding protein